MAEPKVYIYFLSYRHYGEDLCENVLAGREGTKRTLNNLRVLQAKPRT